MDDEQATAVETEVYDCPMPGCDSTLTWPEGSTDSEVAAVINESGWFIQVGVPGHDGSRDLVCPRHLNEQ